jgi:hypothetical protein
MLKTAAAAYIAVIAIITTSSNVVHSNDVIIHNSTSQAVFIFSNLIDQYSKLWKSEEFVKLSENQWMRILLRFDWKTRIFEKVKVYSLELKDKKLVDQTFDDLQDKERLKFITKFTSFSYLVFVVWKNVNDKKKKRVVVNIRDLNAIILFDAYSLFLQFDVISAVKRCHFLSIIDCASFFYQWRVHSENLHKLIVVFHRDQKIFQVAIMNYKNSSSYVQRQIDRLFRELSFVKVFINDIIIYSRILIEHVDHLKQIFSILIHNEIFVNLKKIFLEYFSIQLFDQKMNSLDLTIDEEKLKAIVKLKFSRILKQLEHYLELIEWMREYVFNYVEVSQSLQNRKTLLLKSSSVVEFVRRKFSLNIRLLNLTFAKKQTFEHIQNALSKRRRLIHVDIERQLYDDVDVSKKFDIDVMIYHVKNDEENLFAYSSRSKIELILFLNRQLKSVEKNYWFIELKIADIVFIIRKIRHMIEFFKKSIILFIDHESVLEIIKQISLLIISIDKLNLRLVRASEYIQRFNVIIKHKSRKQHIVSDALFRLASDNDENISNSSELNALFIITLIEMNSAFRKKIIAEYFKNKRWIKILHSFEKKDFNLSFTLNNDLIYRFDNIALEHVYESIRLCISSNAVLDILSMTHSHNHHSEFVKSYDIIFVSWYIHELTKHFREYLRHCSKCQIFQTRRHKSYDSLQSILISNVSFHIIAIDFILALSDSRSNNFNTMMFTICKFFKKITLISEKTNWKANIWALALLTRLKLIDWELSKTIIFDRDSKFLIELWKIIFNKFEIKLLYFTTYYLQTNEQSKRTNQSVKIVLRYHLVSMKHSSDWSNFLSTIQFQLNNFVAAHEKIFNEMMYDFISIQSEDMIRKNSTNISQLNSTTLRKQVIDAIAWTQMIMKINYDHKHTSLNMNVEDFALLRLHKDYNISTTKILKKKLSQQYVDSFKVLEKIENLVYRLNFFQNWRIHSVISIAQLKSISDSIIDSFNRSDSIESESVEMKEDTKKVKFFEIERLIDRRMTTRRDVKYLVRWKDYESQYDEWRNLSELQNALNLINDYEKFMNNIISLFDRLSRINFVAIMKIINEDFKIARFIESNLSQSSGFLSFEKITHISNDTVSLRSTAMNSLNDQFFLTRRFIRRRKSSRERDDII